MPLQFTIKITLVLLILLSGPAAIVQAQAANDMIRNAAQKVEKGFDKNSKDTLAQGYYDLGESYYQKNDLLKSEVYYKKAKALYEKMGDADGIAKSSRALANVQEVLHKPKEAIGNYNAALQNSVKTGNSSLERMNGNDISRLTRPDSASQNFLLDNIKLGIQNKDTNELISNYSRLGDVNLKNKSSAVAVTAYTNAYNASVNRPEQAMKFNQLITDVYVQNKDFAKAIETKKQALSEPFAQNSTQIQAAEITSLADIYIQKREDTTAIRLLNESYALSVKNGHTLEARKNVEKLDSIFQSKGKKEKSLELYRNFLSQLPTMISMDSSLADTRLIARAEEKLRKLETEKTLKDSLLKKTNIFNYWLIASVVVLLVLTCVIWYMLRKLRMQNKKIALQSLRREMNPHFIFNSLNSINQFIANNNELEANQYLTKFSTLMRRVMENSKEDFVLLSNEVELLQNYLELEKSRFPDKFDFTIKIADALYADEQLYIPGMLIQPYLENAIWHGLRYVDGKGILQLELTKGKDNLHIRIEDNGIGMAESRKGKTANQKKHSGRGMSNTTERIRIFNELYRQNITCAIEDKAAPGHGVIINITLPLIKNFQA